MRGRSSWAGKTICFAAGLFFVSAAPLFPAAKQVRVTAERASIYIEPSRTSSRIEIVSKGTILNLLQEKKVNQIWYYVSFSSPRYGTRISGFVQESAVELITGGPPAPSAPPPPPVMDTMVIAKLPKSRTYRFPRKEPPLQESAWKAVEKPPLREVKTPVEVRKFALRTAVPKRRLIALDRVEKTRADIPWQVVQPIIARATEPPEKKEVKPKAEVRKKPPETKPEAGPAEPQPVRMPQVRPPRRGPGLLTFGLGYGSSFGGAGGCLQLNTGTGLSLHAGIGLYPTTLVYSETDWVKNKILWSVGLKYYLPVGFSSFSPYIDIQYGGLRVEAAQVVVGIWDYQFVLHNEQKSLWGPSALAGFEYRLGSFGINAAVGAAYTTTSWEYLENKMSFVFDTGLVVHF